MVSPQSFGVYPKYSLENIKCKIQLLKCQKGTIDKGHKILQLVFTFTLGTRTAILILEEKLDSYFLCCWSNCHSINYYSPTFYFTYINMWNERWENHLRRWSSTWNYPKESSDKKNKILYHRFWSKLFRWCCTSAVDGVWRSVVSTTDGPSVSSVFLPSACVGT